VVGWLIEEQQPVSMEEGKQYKHVMREKVKGNRRCLFYLQHGSFDAQVCLSEQTEFVPSGARCDGAVQKRLKGQD